MSGIFYVLQGKCPDAVEELRTYGPQVAKDLQAALAWLRSGKEGDDRPELKAARKQFQDQVVDAGYPARFVAAVAGLASDELKETIENVNRDLKQGADADISLELYDLPRLYDRYIARIESTELAVPKDASFRVLSDYHVYRSRVTDALIAEVPLLDIYRLYTKYGLGLFARNLRVPIAKSPFNKGIRDTLDNDNERPSFWFYNNGLTAICSDFSIAAAGDDPAHMTSVHASDLQVVNGCQTCASIYYTGIKWNELKRPVDALESATVLVRLIKVGDVEGSGREFAFKVARYTNSQTPITHRDLHANDPEQARLRDIFGREWKYFLETKKGEFARRIENDPDFKVNYDSPFYLPNDEVAQAFVAFWQNAPAFAKASKQQLFADQDRYGSIFGFGIQAEALLLPTALWYLADFWRKKRNFVARHGRKRRPAAVSRLEVVRHGELYLLSTVGASFKIGWNVDRPQDLQPAVLKNCCANIKELWPVYKRPPRGRLQSLARDLDAALDSALDITYKATREACEKDPELNTRNFLIRPSSWQEIEAGAVDAIRKSAQALRLKLETTQ